MPSYQFFDYRLDSSWPLPELQEVVAKYEPAAGVISLDQVEHAIEAFEVRHHWPDSDMLCSFGGGRYRLSFPGQLDARIGVEDGRIEFQAIGNTAAATVRHLILDQVLPRFLSHRGELVLHGSSVNRDGATVAFLGPSGVGKSSLAASFGKHGWRLLSDDCLLVRQNQQGAMLMLGSYPGVRLYQESAAFIFKDRNARSLPAGVAGKSRYEVLSVLDARLLTMIVALEDQNANADMACSMTGLAGADALQTLLGESFSLDPSDHEKAVEKLKRIALLVERVPLLKRLGYVKDFNSLANVRQVIHSAAVSASTPGIQQES